MSERERARTRSGETRNGRPGSEKRSSGRLWTEGTSDGQPGGGRTPDDPIGRRRFLAVGASAAGVALAGCSAVADLLAGMILEDVNVFNGTDRELSGSIEVLDPNGDVVLEETFDLPAGNDDDGDEGGNESDDGGEPDEESMGIYGDVLTDSGEYTVAIELEETVGGETGATETVEVSDPEEEHVMVFLGADDADESILIAVVESFSDLEEYDDEFSE